MGSKSPLMVALGVIVAVTSAVTFGLINMEVLDNAIQPIAAWIFVGGFAIVYLLSDREINQFTDVEAIGFVIPLLGAIGAQHITEVQNLLTEYSPYAGIALTGLTFAGFYALSTDMSLEYVSLELVIGSVLLTTAAVQFDLIELDIVGNQINEISVWVFLTALLAAYLVSERSVGSLNNIELTGLIVGIGAFVGFEYVPEVQSWIMSNNPHAGIGLTAIVLFGYYTVMNNGNFSSPF